jgi:hypothetical protein
MRVVAGRFVIVQNDDRHLGKKALGRKLGKQAWEESLGRKLRKECCICWDHRTRSTKNTHSIFSRFLIKESMQITKIQVLAFLILFAGTITFAIEALTGGINDMSMYTIAILTGVSSIFIIAQPQTWRSLLSGAGPLDIEGIKIDAKFDDFRLNGTVVGTINE